MTDDYADTDFPPEAKRAFWSEAAGHLGAMIVTIPAATLLLQHFPEWKRLGPLGICLGMLVIALPIFRSISRYQIFRLPPDPTPWPLFFGLVRWAPRELSDALPPWQIHAGAYYGPGVARAVGFGFSVIFSTLAVAALTGPILQPLWLTIPGLLFACAAVIVYAFFHNRLPPRDGTSSLF